MSQIDELTVFHGTETSTYESSFGETKPTLHNFDIKEIDGIIRIHMDKEFIEKGLELWTSYQDYNERRHNYLIVAVKNLLKKTNFLELTQEFLQEELSEEEYYNEIQKNPDKYSIKIRKVEEGKDILVISDLIREIGFEIKDFSVNEVAELFSLDSQQIVGYVSSISQNS